MNAASFNIPPLAGTSLIPMCSEFIQESRTEKVLWGYSRRIHFQYKRKMQDHQYETPNIWVTWVNHTMPTATATDPANSRSYSGCSFQLMYETLNSRTLSRQPSERAPFHLIPLSRVSRYSFEVSVYNNSIILDKTVTKPTTVETFVQDNSSGDNTLFY